MLPRAATAGGTMLASMLAYVALAMTPRLPLRVLLPPMVFTWWAALGLVPVLPYAIGWPWLGVAVGLAQCGVAAAAFLAVRRGGWGPAWLDPARLTGPRFGWTRTAAIVAGSALLLPLLLTAYLALGVASTLDHYSNGFVRFGYRGLDVAERRYRLIDGRVVDLVGMIHVGDREGYQAIFADFGGEDTVVLEEGVTDARGLLETTLSYEALSEGLDLALQPRIEAVLPRDREWPHVRNADVDVSDFSPATLAFLEQIATLYASASPAELFRRLGEISASPEAPRWVAAAERDLIGARNRRLLEVVDDSLEHYSRVVVPWGAYHMPGIEQGLYRRGFALEAERRRPLVPYAAIVRGLKRLVGLGTASRPGALDAAGAGV